jgi:Protein of unknown function (DUF2845)
MKCSIVMITSAATLLVTATSSVLADSMECDGNLVSSGDTPESVLNNCGEPTSRNGDQWIYQSQDENSLPKIVTFSNGVVFSISDGNYPGFQNTPFENQP